MDSLLNFYEHLPLLIKWPVWFIVNIILVRGILANEIMSELKQRKLLSSGIIHNVMKHLNSWSVVARKSAIVNHYRLQALGAGHDSPSVLSCGQDKCGMFSH